VLSRALPLPAPVFRNDAESTVQDETANKSDDSAADGVQGDHAGQQECEHHEGCAALPVAVSACDHNPGNAD
jgi:hypothetical protein